MRAVEQPDRGGLGAAIGRITEGVSRLVSEHLALARVELREDARALAVNVVGIAIFVPLVLVGYGFVMGALVCGLAALVPALGIGWSLLIVGALNIAVGGFGAYQAAMKLKERQVLESTRVEVTRTTETIASVTRPSNGATGGERRLGA